MMSDVGFVLLSLANGVMGDEVGRVGWTSPDCGRSTTDIIWSCLSTILICIWTAVHVDFDFSFWDKKPGLMLVGILAPEIMVIRAVNDWCDSRTWHRLASEHCAVWKIEHSWILFMRGWRSGANVPNSGEVLERSQVIWLLSHGVVDESTLPTREEILDRSKADGLVKALACAQSSWVVLQIFSRAAQKLPVTSLEITTSAYVLCALASYAFWWTKPQDVESHLILNCKPFTPQQAVEFTSTTFSSRIPESSLSGSLKGGISLLVSVAFGAVHISLWNSSIFPSKIERDLWRAASLATTVIPMFFFAWLILGYFLFSHKPGHMNLKRNKVPAWALISIYLIIRLYLVVEPFAGLRSVPSGVYQDVKWTSFIPHV